jgi:hypothetical protein
VGCAVTVGIVAAVKATTSDNQPKVSGVARGVDLDQVIETFKTSGGMNNLKTFEDALNAKVSYPQRITVGWATVGKPAIVGFVDKNANQSWDAGIDQQVFRLEIERRADREYRIIASDGSYYRYHSIWGDLATMYLAGSIMNMLWYRHATVWGYGPRMVYSYRYAPAGYHRSPAYSRGSWGGRSSGGRVGGK